MHAAISIRQISDAIISLVTALVNVSSKKHGFPGFSLETLFT
jgi:hypothetical protein